jgi:hypothetical protein
MHGAAATISPRSTIKKAGKEIYKRDLEITLQK